MKYFVFVLFLFVLLIENTYSQYPNFKIHPSSNIQIEPVIVRNPVNPQMLFASSFNRVGSSLNSEGVYVTTNSGLNWFGSDTCTGAPINNHTGDPGPIIDKNGIFILTHTGGPVPNGMFANVSTNMGSTWSNSVLVASEYQEKGSPGTDGNPSSAFYGRTYLAWSRFTQPYNIVLSYTTTSGSSWTQFVPINTTPSGHLSLGSVVSCSDNGNVFVSWGSALITGYAEDCIGFASSTNGGVNWSPQECIFPVGGIRTISFPPWGLRMNGFPSMDVDNTGGSRNGWIYIVSAEKNHAPAGSDADIVFHRSTNNGQSWSSGIRVNQDAINNGKLQFMPVITVDNNGGINAAYYDTRNSTDSVEVYISRSINGGDTWNDYKISDHKFLPKAATSFGPGLWGDHIGMTNAGGKLFPVWMDDYNSTPGNFQIWSAIIDINTIGIEKIGTEIPASFSLRQNFPNPFNPATKIRFDIPNSGNGLKDVKLVIYDNSGKEIKTIVNQALNAGSYEATWEAAAYSSGVYYYRLSYDNFYETRKMVLIK